MDEKFMKSVSSLVTDVMPTASPKCENPNCSHASCNYDEKTGEWYNADVTATKEPTEEELPMALMAAQLKELRSIKKMLAFFTALTVIGIAYALYTALR